MPAVDVAILVRLRSELGGDHAVMRELADAFFKQSPRLLAEAAEGAAKNESALIARAVHTLKSSAATLGAVRLAHLARELELEAAQGGVRDAGSRVKALADEYAAVERALQGWLADGHQK